MLTRIPCVLMRGGTSRGPYFLARDLPRDLATRDRVLLAAMGSPNPLQVDGIGGAYPQTSKVAIISPSERPGIDVDYLFAQVAVDQGIVDTSPNCGNILAGVGPFAIDQGLVPAEEGETLVRIYNVNTKAVVEAIVATPGRRVEYEGDVSIDGVPGTAAPVKLNFEGAIGSKTGALLPTGARREVIDGIPVTLIDHAMPMMLVGAESLGLSGDETPEALDADTALLNRLEALRLEAGVRMGLGDVTGKVIPKVGVLSPPRRGGSLTSRYFVPDRCHRSHAVTGAIAVATAALLPGTVAHAVTAANPGPVVIEHPAGRIDIDLVLAVEGAAVSIRRAAVIRTARRLFEGSVLIPGRVWAGDGVDDTSAPEMIELLRT